MSKSAIHAPFVRSPYNYDTMAASDESGLFCADPSLTQQQFKEETDINYIIDLYTRTGVLPQSNITPQFGDFTHATDYHSALNLVKASEMTFMSLPAALRARFGNDPGQLIGFLNDSENRDEAIRLGLVDAPPSEGLSTGSPERPQGASGGETVGKAGQRAKAPVRPSKGDSEGDDD